MAAQRWGHKHDLETPFNARQLNATSDNTMVAHLGIVYTRWAMMCWKPKCRLIPVLISRSFTTWRRVGGAGGNAGIDGRIMMTRDGQCVVGTELNATHHARCLRERYAASASRCILVGKSELGNRRFR